MPELELSPGASLFYRDDDLTDAWRDAETLFLLHGYGESGLAWYRWMPVLSRRLRVVRPDMRGFGRSTPMPLDHRWSVDEIARDYIRLADALGIERFHVAGAKIGGGIALRLAASYSARVRSLTVLGSRIISGRGLTPERIARRQEELRGSGVEVWARGSMRDRLGASCPPDIAEGWAVMMGGNALSTMIGFVGTVPEIDVRPDLPRVACPALLIITDPGTGELAEETRARQERMPSAELFVVPSDANHVAAAHPEACAGAVLAFIERNSG